MGLCVAVLLFGGSIWLGSWLTLRVPCSVARCFFKTGGGGESRSGYQRRAFGTKTKLACEQALLFGRVSGERPRKGPPPSRFSVSSRVPLVHLLFAISPKWRATILDKIKWNSKPPSPSPPPPHIKNEAAQKPKRAIFRSLIWRGGRLGFPFILSKIAILY